MSEENQKRGWFKKLKDGLKKSSTKLTSGITSVITKRKLDDDVLEELEDLMIMSDLGVEVSAKVTQSLAKKRFNQDVIDEEVKTFFANEISEILEPYAKPLTPNPEQTPHVILVVGVNGSGKTTTIGKLAHYWQQQNHKVHIAAADTFRAAAVEQLGVWANRSQIPMTKGPQGCDPASVAFEALQKAKQENADILMIDTAGRLHNKTDLMDELAKIKRVIQKLDDAAPHSCLLVLDATTGQNAHSQVEIFKSIAHLTGLIVTKLDGTARGGVVVSLAQKFELPIHAIGVGEGVDDLRPFEAKAFSENLMGL